MKAWIVRFVSLYVFNVVVLLVIGWLTPAHVGWAALWASVILTLAELFVKPLIHGAFTRFAAKSAGERTRMGDWLVQTLLVLAVAAIIWLITLLLTGVDAHGSWFWAYVLPPIILTIGWWVYARVDNTIEAKAGEYYDRASAGLRRSRGSDAAGATTATAVEPSVKAEVDDGLTPEQRRMLDDLGK